MLEQLQWTNIRNLATTRHHFSGQLNIITGNNGSGKTSVLEAIYLLFMGQSFRTSRLTTAIHLAESGLTLHGLLADHQQVGLEKFRKKALRIKINGKENGTRAALIRMQPCQLLHTEGFVLLEGGPKWRRQFLDWGVFHVEQQFLMVWQQYSQALQQRNAALKQGASLSSLVIWDDRLFSLAEQLEYFRQQYLLAYEQSFLLFANRLLSDTITIQYQRGWPQDMSLSEAFSQAYGRDRQLGYTQFGPHRADMMFMVSASQAKQHLSRGQQKLLIFALRLAQGHHLFQETEGRCLYLLDDIAAELDKVNQGKVLQALQDMEAQVFITAIERQALPMDWLSEAKWFHVEHGRVNEQ